MSRRTSPVSLLSQSNPNQSPSLSSRSLFLDGRYNVETFIRPLVERAGRRRTTDLTITMSLETPSLKLRVKGV